jgi:hypothetical protein
MFDILGFILASLLLIWNGLRMLGEGIIGVIRAVLGIFGVVVPDFIIELATIIVFLLVIFKYGKHISKIILVILLLLLASVLFGALFGG